MSRPTKTLNRDCKWSIKRIVIDPYQYRWSMSTTFLIYSIVCILYEWIMSQTVYSSTELEGYNFISLLVQISLNYFILKNWVKVNPRRCRFYQGLTKVWVSFERVSENLWKSPTGTVHLESGSKEPESGVREKKVNERIVTFEMEPNGKRNDHKRW